MDSLLYHTVRTQWSSLPVIRHTKFRPPPRRFLLIATHAHLPYKEPFTWSILSHSIIPVELYNGQYIGARNDAPQSPCGSILQVLLDRKCLLLDCPHIFIGRHFKRKRRNKSIAGFRQSQGVLSEVIERRKLFYPSICTLLWKVLQLLRCTFERQHSVPNGFLSHPNAQFNHYRWINVNTGQYFVETRSPIWQKVSELVQFSK